MPRAEELFQILAVPRRRLILDTLESHPSGLPVGRLAGLMKAKEPSVSQHLKILSGAGLVEGIREGRRVVYRMAPGSRRMMDQVARTLSRRSGGRLRLSARNRLLGTVTAIERDRVTAAVTLDVCGQTMQSVITTAALDDLRLKVGDSAYAVVKATEVMLMQ